MLAEKNPEVKKAVAKLMTLTEDEQARMVADARDKMRWDIESRERAAKKEGWTEGEANMLARQLTRRFGPLPVWADARLRTADVAQLEVWADAVLDAASLDEVIGAPPERH
ncbi:hypothetical protein AGMMS50225_03460 [Betaproteobacteria bacterium]|nr:hypothetical protein AGMMS50225_03460 [Betaproteobacteria bacterium]